MGGLWKALLTSSLALSATAYQTLQDVVELHRAVRLPPTRFHEVETELGIFRPVRAIYLDDILPAFDSSGNSRCCPPGTINNGDGCVYPESSVCPKGSRFDGNVCIREPVCPDGLVFDGLHCSDVRGQRCPPDTHAENGRCVAEPLPTCPDSTFTYKNGRCVADYKPICDYGFDYDKAKDKCVSRADPKCTNPRLVYHSGSCIDPAGPQCPDPNIKPTKDGRCIGAPPTCDKGYTKIDGLCHHEEPPTCDEGELVNNQCVTEPKVSCKDCEGCKVVGNACVKKLTCDDDLKLVGGVCMKTRTAECPDGGKLLHDGQSRTWACCAEGLEYYDRKCRRFAGDDECPLGSKNINNWCYFDPQPVQCPDDMHFNGARCEKKASPTCDKGLIKNGKCVIAGDFKCPLGSELKGGKCVVGPPPRCPDGIELWHGKCLGPNPTCPDGYRLENDECVGYGDAWCKEGFDLRDGLCKDPGNPICEPGTYLYEGRCVPPGRPVCHKGEVLDNGECVTTKPAVCKENFRNDNGKCVLRGVEPKCDGNLQPVGEKCISPDPLTCPDGHKLVGTKCIADEDPKCGGDMVLDKETKQCVDPTGPICEGDTQMDGGVCKSPDPPTCPEGQTLDSVSGKCEVNDPPGCPEGSTLKGGYCVIDVLPECPDETELVGDKCVAIPKCPPGLKPVGKDCISIHEPKCAPGMSLDRSLNKCVVSTKTECFSMEVCPSIGARGLPAGAII